MQHVMTMQIWPKASGQARISMLEVVQLTEECVAERTPGYGPDGYRHIYQKGKRYKH